MRQVLLPIFLIRLSLSLLPFLSKLALDSVKHLVGLALVLLLVGSSGYFFSNHVEAFLTPRAQTPLSSPPPITVLQPLFTKIMVDHPHTTVDVSEPALTQVEQTLITASGSASLQRDILINQYFLAIGSNNLDQATELLDQLLYLDPNHPLVKEISATRQ